MKKIRLLYDATAVCNILIKNSSRSGIFFVAYNVLLELLKRPEFEIFLYAENIAQLNEIIKVYPEFRECRVYSFSPLDKYISFFVNLKAKNRQEKGLPILRAVYGISASLIKKVHNFVSSFNKFEDLDVYFSPFKAVPNFIKKQKHIKCYTILHDVIPLIEECNCNIKPHDWFYKLIRSINADDYYFANSEYTKKDFIKYTPLINPEHIRVIPLSTGRDYKKITDINVINNAKFKYNIPIEKKFIFSLCSLNPRKNLIFAIKNFIEFTKRNNLEDFIFVLGGGKYDDFEKTWEKHLSTLGDFRDRILHIGYVDDEDMSALYSGAEMLVFPSVYEGFGMPILEAMKCELPVICSNTSSMPEVIGDCGIQIDPYSDEEMISALEKMYFDKSFREQCIKKAVERAKLFTWTKCVDVITSEISGKYEKQSVDNYVNV